MLILLLALAVEPSCKLQNAQIALQENASPFSQLISTNNRATEIIPKQHTKEALQASERKSWSRFFQQEIEIPIPSQELIDTLKKAKEKGFYTFEPHYIPSIEFKEENEDPDFDFDRYFTVKQEKIGGYWCIIDTIERPSAGVYSLRSYDNDPLGNMLTTLRKNGDIADFKIKDSRFNTSWGEIYTVILPQIAEELDVPKDHIRLPYFMEFFYLGHRDYPEWGKAYSNEWTHDLLGENKNHGSAGSASYGGLGNYPDYSHFGPDYRSIVTGFRPIIVFPSVVPGL